MRPEFTEKFLGGSQIMPMLVAPVHHQNPGIPHKPQNLSREHHASLSPFIGCPVFSS